MMQSSRLKSSASWRRTDFPRPLDKVKGAKRKFSGFFCGGVAQFPQQFLTGREEQEMRLQSPCGLRGPGLATGVSTAYLAVYGPSEVVRC